MLATPFIIWKGALTSW